MKAVIKTGGKQYIVSEGDELSVELLGDAKTTTFEPLMLIDGEKSTVGNPIVKNAKVSAKVVDSDVTGEKVTSIRYKAKKRVHKTRGHRQHTSRIKITKISA